jgi:hypothetical protein
MLNADVQNPIIATTRIITFGIIPNFASFHVKITRTDDRITAANARIYQAFDLVRKAIPERIKSKHAMSQRNPENLEITTVNCSISAILKAFKKPIRWIAPWIRTNAKKM